MPEFSDIPAVLCREKRVKKRVIATDRTWVGTSAFREQCRPHAYQANEGELEVRQETYKSLTDGVICRCSPFAMPDNVGVNRQLNRQQKIDPSATIKQALDYSHPSRDSAW